MDTPRIDVVRTGDFAYWSELARSDKKRFDSERQRVIEEEIMSVSLESQLALRKLQSRIDSARNTATETPIEVVFFLETGEEDFVRFEDERRIAIELHISQIPASKQEMLREFQLHFDFRRRTNISDPNIRAYWAELEKTDHDRCQGEREHCLQMLILKASAGKQLQLQRLLWKINAVCSRATNPLSSCVRSSEMMWTYLVAEDGFFHTSVLWRDLSYRLGCLSNELERLIHPADQGITIEGEVEHTGQRESILPPRLSSATIFHFPKKN